MPHTDLADLDQLSGVLTGRLSEIGARFSAMLAPLAPHRALVVFTRECTGRPRKTAGDAAIVDHVTIGELDAVRAARRPGEIYCGAALLAGFERPVVAMLDGRTGTLLVLFAAPDAPQLPEPALRRVRALFGIVATGISLQVAAASPAYLAESRAASTERARTIAELSDAHATTLETLLATLRSKDHNDKAARQSALDTASAALIKLRSFVDVHREMASEAVPTAFARLGGEVRSLVRDSDIQLDLAESHVAGIALPGEVAHAARAVSRGVVLALLPSSRAARVRVEWRCTESVLTVDIRDDGAGDADIAAIEREARARVDALGGTVATESTAGWGTRVTATISLSAPAAAPAHALDALAARELEVLAHIAAGQRNREIAQHLGVSESTVKFHVGNVLRKLRVQTRGAAVAIAVECGMAAVR